MNNEEAKRYVEQMAYEKRLEWARKHPKGNEDYKQMLKESEDESMSDKHFLSIYGKKREAKRIAQSLKNLGYKARVVKRHFAEDSANYDLVYSTEKKLIKV